MRTKEKLITILCAICFIAQVNAQISEVPRLIISEWRGDNMQSAYVELTNVGDEAINLSDFTAMSVRPWSTREMSGDTLRINNVPSFFQKRLADVVLSPGSSYVIMNVYDGLSNRGGFIHRTQMLPLADLIVHVGEGSNQDFLHVPEKETFGKDSTDNHHRLLWQVGGRIGWALVYHQSEAISYVVDGVNLAWGNDDRLINEPSDVAGIMDATESHILVRKASVINGNTNWDDSRGVSPENSEWIPIPHDGMNFDGDIYTTVGNHGDFSIDISSEDINIDMDNAILTVPWGIEKGDSIIDEFTLGDGMAWQYFENGIFEDSASTICKTGDVLRLFACGSMLEQMDFDIEIQEPSDDMNLVFPKRIRIYPDLEEGPSQSPYWGEPPYYVTKSQPAMDTIGDVLFATRVDTLFKYLEKAPNALWEIEWVDGTERPDLKHGDILKVTAENGETKEYFIDVQAYSARSNAKLSAITWPDAPAFLQNTPHWNHDTIPGFSSSKKAYEITIPYGTSAVPALKVYTQDLNATIDSVHRAISLSGLKENRTTSIVVRAEDDTTTTTYTVTFVEEQPPINIQPYQGEPMITQLGLGIYERRISYLEISVPGNQTVDLSNYMIATMAPPTDPNQLITNNWDDWSNRYVHYVPGYDFVADSASQWNNIPGIIEKDLAVNPVLQGGESFLIGHNHSWRFQNHHLNNHNWVAGDIDVYFTRQQFWDRREYFGLDQVQKMVTNGNDGISLTSDPAYFGEPGKNVVAIFKILNEEVKNGNKALGEDPADYQLIEVFGDYASDAAYSPGKDTLPDAWNNGIWRKPEYFTPDTAPGVQGSWANTDEESEWIYIGDQHLPEDIGYDDKNRTVGGGLGNHIFDPITIHESTVASLVYKVSDGYKTPQNIVGVSNGEDVSEFLGNLIKADEGQVLTVLSSSGDTKSDADAIADGDTLQIISADSRNTTKYGISTTALDDDAVLTSITLNITINGVNGTIAGFSYGTSIKDILNDVSVPAAAILNIINEDEELVPLTQLNYDTLYVNTLASENIFFEVIAENGDIITYQLQPDVSADDVTVYSNAFEIDQNINYILSIPEGINMQQFLMNLIVAEGTDVKVKDKAGFIRDTGKVSFDDYLHVTSADGTNSARYDLEFKNEPEAPLRPLLLVNYDGQKLVNGDVIDLGYIHIDNDDFSVNLNISNAGGSVLSSIEATLTGDNYSISTSPSAELAPKQKSNIVIDMETSNVGVYEGEVTISSNDSVNPSFSVELRAEILDVPNEPVAELTIGNTVIEPAGEFYDMGITTINNTITKTVTLKNIGLQSLELNDTNFNYPFGSDFDGGLVLNYDDSVVFEVHFTPTYDDYFEESMEFEFNTGWAHYNLSGLGVRQEPTMHADYYNGEDVWFDRVSIPDDTEETIEITIWNIGMQDLEITTSFDSDAFQFTDFPSTISFGDTVTFSVTFNPSTAGHYAEELIMNTNDPDISEYNLSFEGDGVDAPADPMLSFTLGDKELKDNDTLHLGNVMPPNGFSQLMFMIENAGLDDLMITPEALNSPFIVQSNGENIMGQSFWFDYTDREELMITFHPMSGGIYSDSLVLMTNHPDDNKYVLNLIGNGIISEDTTEEKAAGISVMDDNDVEIGYLQQMHVGEVTVTEDTLVKSFSLENTGEVDLTNVQAELSGEGYVISRDLSDTELGTGESTTFEIEFAVESAGYFTGEIKLSANELENAFKYYLNAKANEAEVPVQIPEITVNDNSDFEIDRLQRVSFGRTSSQGGTTERTFKIMNTGDILLENLNVSITDSAFSVNNLAKSSLNLSEETTFDIQFAPTAENQYSGEVMITADNMEKAFKFYVKGTGMDAPVEPSLSVFLGGRKLKNDGDTLHFGHIATNQGISQMSLVLANKGMDALEITPLFGGAFSLGTDKGNKLDSSETFAINHKEPVELMVMFEPKAEQTYRDSFVLLTNDTEIPSFKVNVKGIGIPEVPTILVKEDSAILKSAVSELDFGVVKKDSSVRKTLQMGNIGLSPLSASLNISEENGFAIAKDIGKDRLLFGNSVEFSIAFIPSGNGKVENTLVLESNDPNQADFIIKLIGEGDGFTSIQDVKAVDVEIYPNPATDILNIITSSKVSVELYNMLGIRVLHKANIYKSGEMNVSVLDKGVYLLRCVDEAGRISFTKKVIIQ